LEGSPREDLDGWLAGVGWWLEAHCGGVNSLWVVSVASRFGGPHKAAQIPEEGNGSLEREKARERERVGWAGRKPGEQGQCWECTRSKSQHQNVRKNAACKESSREKSHVQEQGLMVGSNCQAGWGKMAQCWLWARSGLGMAFVEEGAWGS
jgi:hypothetical protein